MVVPLPSPPTPHGEALRVTRRAGRGRDETVTDPGTLFLISLRRAAPMVLYAVRMAAGEISFSMDTGARRSC